MPGPAVRRALLPLREAAAAGRVGPAARHILPRLEEAAAAKAKVPRCDARFSPSGRPPPLTVWVSPTRRGRRRHREGPVARLALLHLREAAAADHGGPLTMWVQQRDSPSSRLEEVAAASAKILQRDVHISPLWRPPPLTVWVEQRDSFSPDSKRSPPPTAKVPRRD